MTIAEVALAGGVAALALLRAAVLERPRDSLVRFDYRHQWIIEDARSTDRQLPVGPTAVVTKGAYTRPNALHWALSKLRRESAQVVSRRVGWGAELLVAGVVLGIALLSDLLSTVAFAVAAAVILLTPQFVRADRPGTPGFDPTTAGLALSAVGAAAMLGWATGGHAVWFVVATLVTAAVVLVDRLALFSHGLAMLAIAVVEPLSSVALLGGIVTAVILSCGRAVRFLAAHLKYIIDGVQHRRPYTRGGSGWLRFESQVTDRPLSRIPNFIISLVGFNPFAVTGLITAIAAVSGTIPTSSSTAVLTAWLFGGMLGFVLTGAPNLSIAGPPDAYLLGSVVPAALLTGHGVDALGGSYLALVGVAVVTGGAFCLLSRRTQKASRPDRMWEDLLDTLTTYDRGVLLVSPSDRATELAFKTHHRVADSLCNEEASTSDLDVLFPETHLQLSDDPNMLRNIQYYVNPDWAVVDSARTDLPESALSSATPTYENERYRVFEFEDLVEMSP